LLFADQMEKDSLIDVPDILDTDHPHFRRPRLLHYGDDNTSSRSDY